jgi:metallophosphoesterase (TIGR00282 family)
VRILFIGDIVGEPGRNAVRRLVPRLRERLALDVVIANGENMAGGAGITARTASEIFDAGVDVITSGDHIWDQKEIMAYLPAEPRIVRPLNYPSGAPGQGSYLLQKPSLAPIVVLNAQGRVFMASLENPFQALPAELRRWRNVTPLIFLDFHAEATSEKIAIARLLDGQVSAVIGTHTHVQTADEQLLPGGTAYLTDAGFTGAHESVLGREIEPVLKSFQSNLPQRFAVATGRPLLQGAVVELDQATGRALSIQRVSERVPEPQP